MEYFTRKYDNQLLDIGSCENENGEEENGFYSNFPQMLPWVGINYGIDCKKLLLIGESHYLPQDCDSELLNPDIWYNQDHTEYYSDEDDVYSYTNTRDILNAGKWSSIGHAIYREPNRIIEKTLLLNNIKSDNYLSYVAYYNYFLRPAENGKSIKQSMNQSDEKISIDTFNEMIHILKPEAVFLLSKFAYENFVKNNEINYDFPIGFAPHPSCSWWNRVSYHSNGLTGKEKFEHFLRSNKIF